MRLAARRFFRRTGWLLASMIFVLWVNVPAHAQSNDQKAWAELCTDWDDWDKSGPAFLIHGSSYYVGTCGISAILITGSDGHVLIDGGTEAGGEIIARNIAALGFEISDVKILLHSHEHFDHVAGLAHLQRLSGAQLLASEAAAPVLATGELALTDPQYGLHEPFPPVRVDRILDDGEVVELGELAIQAISTPGHTPGALSWRWESCDGASCEVIVYADSLSPVSRPSYRFSDYPQYIAAFRRGLSKFSQLGCTILISTHPSASYMPTRLAQGGLMGPNSCPSYAEVVEKKWTRRLEKEKSGG